MKLTVLNDNIASRTCGAEFGLSYYIEEKIKILFDTGPTDIFLKNAKILNKNLHETDYIVLSHGHWDHGNGLQYLFGQKLICHPQTFVRRFKKDGTYVGLIITEEAASKQFNLISTNEPYQISDKIYYLGEIPRHNDFEFQDQVYFKNDGSFDYVQDDSALAIDTKQGLIIVSGCSHSGICNIIEHAKNIIDSRKVHAVIGGFHLQNVDERLERTIEYFKNEKIDLVLPSHCTSYEVKFEFYKHFNMQQVTSGSIFQF
ncbi:MBL fold metallo-hydrolase [Bacteroidota bacterium]